MGTKLTNCLVRAIIAIVMLATFAGSTNAQTCSELNIDDPHRFAILPNPSRSDSVRQWLEACLTVPSTSAEQQFSHALVLVQLGRYEDAEAIIQFLDSPDATRLAAALLSRRTDDADAIGRAVQVYRKLADRGDASAAEALGLLLARRGLNEPSNLDEVIRLFTTSESLGSISAAMRLGLILTSEGPSKPWFRIGRDALERAVHAGNWRAHVRLSEILWDGRGQERDQVRAASLLEKAADAGDPEAEHQLGRRLEEGWYATNDAGSWKRDFAGAVKRYRTAAARGYAPAAVDAGTILAYSMDGLSDPPEGLRLLLEALKLGASEAAERIALIYELGLSVPVDLEAARRYYQIAASTGHPRSMVALNRLKATNADIWKSEQQRLRVLEDDDGGEKSNPSRYFTLEREPDVVLEALATVTLTVLDQSGRRAFHERIYRSEKVNLESKASSYLVIEAEGIRASGRPGDLAKVTASGLTYVLGGGSGSSTWRYEPGRAPTSATLPELPQTSTRLVALSGFDDSIEIFDPDFVFPRRSLTDWSSASIWSGSTIKLDEPRSIAIPRLPMVNVRVRGGTEFVIEDNGRRQRIAVPEGMILYMSIPQRLLNGHFEARPPAADPMPLEVEFGMGPLPPAAVLSDNEPVGWLYKAYDTKNDGVIATFVPGVFESAAGTKSLRPDWEAVLRLRRALASQQARRSGIQSIEYLGNGLGLARAFFGLGRSDEAIELLETTISGIRRLLGTRSDTYSEALRTLADIYRSQGDLGRATVAARRAISIAGRLPGNYSDNGNFKVGETSAEARQVLSGRAGLPHGSYQPSLHQATEILEASGALELALVYRYQLAAYDLLRNPRAEFADGETYLAILQAEKRRSNEAGISPSASLAPWATKASFGVAGLPDPLPLPITQPSGFDRLFGPIHASSAAALSLTEIGEAYLAAGRPASYARPVFAAALTAATNTAALGSETVIRAASGAAKAEMAGDSQSDPLMLLRKASGYEETSGAFPPFAGVTRTTRIAFFDAYLEVLRRQNRMGWLDGPALAQQAAAVFFSEQAEDLSYSFSVGLERLRGKTEEQRMAAEQWLGAKSEFERLNRRLLASDRGSATQGGANAILAREDLIRRETEAVRKRLLVAEQAINQSFAGKLLGRNTAQDLNKLQAMLSEDEAVLVLLPLSDSLNALTITKREVHYGSQPVNEFQLVLAIKAFRQAVDPAILRSSRGAGSAFDSVAIGPLVALRAITLDQMSEAAQGKKRLTLVLHGVLRNVPFEAMPLNLHAATINTKLSLEIRWAGLHFELAYLPGLQALVDLRSSLPASAASKAFSAVADPILAGDPRLNWQTVRQQFQGIVQRSRAWVSSIKFLDGIELEPIPETRRLVEELRVLLNGNPADLLTGERATRQTVLNSPVLAQSRVIAFATHGLTAEEATTSAGEPFLALTSTDATGQPDALTASEISRLRLDAELVLLTACNTAAPDGTPGRQGFSGLTQAFLASGVRSIVATHWIVRSDAAQEFAVETLFQAARNGAMPAEAVRLGRIKVAQRLSHPAFWAGFIYVGDPGRAWALR